MGKKTARKSRRTCNEDVLLRAYVYDTCTVLVVRSDTGVGVVFMPCIIIVLSVRLVFTVLFVTLILTACAQRPARPPYGGKQSVFFVGQFPVLLKL